VTQAVGWKDPTGGLPALMGISHRKLANGGTILPVSGDVCAAGHKVSAEELPRISIPRTPVNKGKGKVRGCNYSLSPAFTYR
jgi:hypothetical protein